MSKVVKNSAPAVDVNSLIDDSSAGSVDVNSLIDTSAPPVDTSKKKEPSIVPTSRDTVQPQPLPAPGPQPKPVATPTAVEKPNFGLLADPSLEVTKDGSRFNSPLLSPSATAPVTAENKKVTEPDSDALPKIAAMAQRQDAAKGMMPISLQGPNDIFTQEQQQGRYNKIMEGNVDEIARTIKAERDRLKELKAQPKLDAPTQPVGHGLPGLSMVKGYGSDSPQETELNQLEQQLKPLQQKAAEKIDQHYATQLLSLNGKELQDKAPEIGKDRRRKLADIGLDASFDDEQGAAQWALKNKVAYGWMPGKVTVNSDKYTQEADYLNERGVYDAALNQLGDQIDRLGSDSKVQLYMDADAATKKLLESDPTIQDFKTRLNRYEYLNNLAQSLPAKYPAVKYEQDKQRISDAFANRLHATQIAVDGSGGGALRQLKDLFFDSNLDTDQEYQQISNDTGIPVDVVKAHAEQDAVLGNVGVPSYLGRALRGAVGIFNSAGQGLNRLTMEKDKANVVNRELEGVNYQTPEQLLSQHWTTNKIFDTMANGLGQFVGFVASAGVIGAPLKGAAALERTASIAENVAKAADIGGTLGSGFYSSYESAYRDAAQYTSDEDARHAYAQGDAWANGLSELILKDIDVADKILKGGVPKAQLLTDFLKGKVSTVSAAKVFAARMAEFGKTLGYESAEEMMPYLVDTINKDNILGQKTSTSAFLNGAFDTIVQTMISTVPMAALSSTHVPSSHLTQAALYEAAKNPEKYKAMFDQQYADGKITGRELNQHNQLINTVRDIAAGIPEVVDGKTLNEQQRAQLTFNLLKQRNLADQKKKADAALHPSIDAEIAAAHDEAKNIIANAPAPAATTADTEEEKPAAAQPQVDAISAVTTNTGGGFGFNWWTKDGTKTRLNFESREEAEQEHKRYSSLSQPSGESAAASPSAALNLMGVDEQADHTGTLNMMGVDQQEQQQQTDQQSQQQNDQLATQQVAETDAQYQASLAQRNVERQKQKGNVTTQSTQERNAGQQTQSSGPGNAAVAEQQQGQAQEGTPQQAANTGNSTEAGPNVQGQGLADRAAAARAGVTQTVTMQDRLAESRKAEEKAQAREQARKERRATLYSDSETQGEPTAPVLTETTPTGETKRYTLPAAPQQVELEPVTISQSTEGDKATAAAAPQMVSLNGVYQFGEKQTVSIKDIDRSNDFRGPRRISKDAIKFLRKKENIGKQEVLLFRHPNGKIYVLDGKAAIEAQQLNRRRTVQARFFHGTVEQAAEVAHMRKPEPPQSVMAARSARVLSQEPKTFEEYALQVMLGLMNKVGQKPAFSLSDFVRYSGFGGVQNNRNKINYGKTIGESDIKDLRSRGVLSDNKGRKLIRFDQFAKEWMDRDGNTFEDEQDLMNQLTDLLMNYQSPQRIVERLEDVQGVEGAPLGERLLPFHVTPEQAVFIAEHNMSDTLFAILNNTDEIPEITDAENAAYDDLIRSFTAPDGTMDMEGIYRGLTESDNAELQSLQRKLAEYATKQEADTQAEQHARDTGGKTSFTTPDGRLVESDEEGNFFSRWYAGNPGTGSQSISTRAAQKVAAVLQKAFKGLEVSFDRETFQSVLSRALRSQKAPLSEQAAYLYDKLQAAQNELKNAQAAFNSKRQQLDRSIQQDQQDLFGARASQTTAGLFDERVDQSAREKAMKPFQDRVKLAKDNVTKLSGQLSDALKQSALQTALFSKEIAGMESTGLRSGQEKIGYQYDTQMTARERFDIPNLKEISKGSDRTVFDLGNGKVLKVAKTARGLEQNIHEGSYDLVDEGIIPEAFERGLNYVVTEKVEPAKPNGYVLVEQQNEAGQPEYFVQRTRDGYRQGEPKKYKSKADAQAALNKSLSPGEQALHQLLYDIADMTIFDFQRRSQRLQDALEKHGMSYILNYDDILFGDFQRAVNWGVGKDGKPIHLDGGTFGGVQMIKQYQGKTNMQDADFRRVYYESKGLKKELGDHDNYTMFSKDGQVYGIVSDGKVYFNPDAVRLDTPMHEIGGHVLTAWAKENHAELYQKILSIAKEAPPEVLSYVKRNYPELSETSAHFAEEVFATALGLDSRNLDRARELAEKDPSGFQKLRTFINNIWNDLINYLVDKGIVKGQTIEARDFRDMSFADFSNLIGGRLAEGRRLSAPTATAVNSENTLLNDDDYVKDKFGNPIKVKEGVQAEIAAEKAAIKEQAIKDGTYLQSPKGTPTLLSPDQWVMVRTKRFQAWDNGKVVRSSDGEPKVFYHGTNTEVNAFRDQQGVWFTPQKAIANQYAGLRTSVQGGSQNVIPVFLRGNMLDSYGGTDAEFEAFLRIGDDPQALRAAGYDGLWDGTGLQVFNAANVKSAVYNSTFSDNTTDIRFSKSTMLEDQLADQINQNDNSTRGQISMYRTLLRQAIEYKGQDKLLKDEVVRRGYWGTAFENIPPTVQRQITAIDLMSAAQKQAVLGAIDDALKAGNPTWNDVARRVTQAMDALQDVPPATQQKPKIRVRVNADGKIEQVPITEKEEKGTKDLDKLTQSVPNSGELSEYLSGKTITTAYGEAPKNDQSITVQKLDAALQHGENMIDKARDIWGDGFALPMLDYIAASTASPSVKALMYVSVENALAQQKIEQPEKAAEITALQTKVYAVTQAYARETSLALNYWRLRNLAMKGFDSRTTTNEMFTDAEVEQRGKVEQAVQADIDQVNQQAEEGPTNQVTADEARAAEEARVAEETKETKRKASPKSEWKPPADAQGKLKDLLEKLRNDLKDIQC